MLSRVFRTIETSSVFYRLPKQISQTSIIALSVAAQNRFNSYNFSPLSSRWLSSSVNNNPLLTYLQTKLDPKGRKEWFNNSIGSTTKKLAELRTELEKATKDDEKKELEAQIIETTSLIESLQETQRIALNLPEKRDNSMNEAIEEYLEKHYAINVASAVANRDNPTLQGTSILDELNQAKDNLSDWLKIKGITKEEWHEQRKEMGIEEEQEKTPSKNTINFSPSNKQQKRSFSNDSHNNSNLRGLSIEGQTYLAKSNDDNDNPVLVEGTVSLQEFIDCYDLNSSSGFTSDWKDNYTNLQNILLKQINQPNIKKEDVKSLNISLLAAERFFSIRHLLLNLKKLEQQKLIYKWQENLNKNNFKGTELEKVREQQKIQENIEKHRKKINDITASIRNCNSVLDGINDIKSKEQKNLDSEYNKLIETEAQNWLSEHKGSYENAIKSCQDHLVKYLLKLYEEATLDKSMLSSYPSSDTNRSTLEAKILDLYNTYNTLNQMKQQRQSQITGDSHKTNQQSSTNPGKRQFSTSTNKTDNVTDIIASLIDLYNDYTNKEASDYYNVLGKYEESVVEDVKNELSNRAEQNKGVNPTAAEQYSVLKVIVSSHLALKNGLRAETPSQIDGITHNPEGCTIM